jgi:hypothetical protein
LFQNLEECYTGDALWCTHKLWYIVEFMVISTQSRQIVNLLIVLWDSTLSRSELIRKAKKKSEDVKDYLKIIDNLTQDGIIAQSIERTTKLKLLEPGKQLLGELLSNSEFEFTAQMGKRSANVLLAVMRSQASRVAVRSKDKVENPSHIALIESYETFLEVALEIFEQINRDFNMDNLVPIYRIRRVIGERVERKNFDTWLLEMQANSAVQLIGGEMPGLTPEIAQDSISTALGAPRYYIKRV